MPFSKNGSTSEEGQQILLAMPHQSFVFVTDAA